MSGQEYFKYGIALLLITGSILGMIWDASGWGWFLLLAVLVLA